MAETRITDKEVRRLARLLDDLASIDLYISHLKSGGAPVVLAVTGDMRTELVGDEIVGMADRQTIRDVLGEAPQAHRRRPRRGRGGDDLWLTIPTTW